MASAACFALRLHASAAPPQVGLTQALGAAAKMTDLWGPIEANDWRHTPCTIGRPATEADVAAGSAVFYVSGDSAAASMALPCCAMQSLEDGSEQAVIIIQAEISPDGTILGVRPLTGGNGICMTTDIRLLPAGFGS